MSNNLEKGKFELYQLFDSEERVFGDIKSNLTYSKNKIQKFLLEDMNELLEKLNSTNKVYSEFKDIVKTKE